MKEKRTKEPYRFPRKDTIRFCKIILLAATALYFTLAVIGNITGYNINFQTVSQNLAVQQLFYWIIIIVEIIIAGLCWAGAFNCAKFFKTKEHFNMSLLTGIIALVLALLLWLVGFITIGGAWFSMWHSSSGIEDTAFRMFVINGITLLFLMVKDE